ncbi:hypothetical protein ACXGQW_05370 [Wenyingzhuangia sp. IMCC45533]
MESFTLAIKSKNNLLSIEQLESIANEYPYFQLAKSLLLKKYHQQEHFKYNNALKNLAAHTHSRELLFEYLNNIEEEHQKVVEEEIIEKPVSIILERPKDIDEGHVNQNETTTEKPFKFNSNEKHSFHQWLHLKEISPIERDDEKVEEKKEGVVNHKLNIINKFIQNNPKISPVKKNISSSNQTFKNTNTDISNELMTETLAKVYLAQKKYDNAIQAYKILSLKYPEKSSLFADQIQRIKILQTHK